MSDPAIKLHKKNTDPQLIDLLKLLKKDIMLNLNCHAIAQIEKFDKDKQTCSATIKYKKTFFEKDQAGNDTVVLKDYPILLDVPVIVLGGSTAHLTFPIASGDECLILFNDRSIDSWLASGQVGPVSSSRLHSFSDGIALVGLNSLANSIQNYDGTRAVLRNDKAMIGVGPNLIRIANDQYNLNQLLQSLMMDLQSLTMQLSTLTVSGVTPGSGVSGVPVGAAALTAIGMQINTTATQIAGLLE
jgi:hypothetical protein